MALTFPTAPTVATGDKILSSQWIALANAFNERKISGIGDWPERNVHLRINEFRQFRNPDSSGLVFPAQMEFFELYQLLDPESGVQYPTNSPGDFEGANLACVINQHVFGNPAMADEPSRLNFDEFTGEGVPLWNGFTPPSTLEDYWELGKKQRGVIDPVSGFQNVPAFTAAQSFFRIATPVYSPHGKTYGAFFPTPVKLLDDCGTTPETGQGVPSYEFFFTGLTADLDTSAYHGTVTTNGDGMPVVTYAGSCPEGTDFTAVGHVLAVFRLPFAIYLVVNNGTDTPDLDRFATADWIEGPYEGNAQLSRYDAGQVLRSIWAFVQDFRGTTAQRNPDTYRIEEIAFDFQTFLTTQYALAPNIGVVSGDGLTTLYPRCEVSSNLPAGSVLTFTNGLTEHSYASGFTCAGVFAKATGLSAPVTVLALDNGNPIASLTLTPDEPEAMLWLTTALAPNPLTVELSSDLVLETGGTLVFEVTEQQEYTAEFWDAYLVLRMMASNGGTADTAGVDGRGLDNSGAHEIWDTFQHYGCISNPLTSGVRDQADWISDNPVYDSARRTTREHMRILARRQFVSYEVAGGKSILRFKRYAYGMDDAKADCFYGIAPSYTPITETIEGETYVVRASSGGVTYLGVEYSDGQQFTATDFSAVTTSGDAQAYVYDGIRATARKKGVTNEWTMFLKTKCYHPSESSIFKPDAYADYYGPIQRCHFYSGSATDGSFRVHTSYNNAVTVTARADGSGFDKTLVPETLQSELIAPEAPSGYNYALGANDSFVSVDFYKSCQIYKPPYEVESATVEFLGAEEIVKLTFKTRFDSHADAPSTVDPDPLTWDAGEISDLTGESYRTDDNALREYALSQVDASYQCSFKTGDSGTASSVAFIPDNPFGSCYPHFFFDRLIPKPYEDGNDTHESWDTRATIDAFTQMEWDLKAGCEGFIDGQTSEEITCRTGEGSLYDYTFENLCFDAFGGRQIGAFESMLKWGHGPSANTEMLASVFNRFSQCVNLLTRARVMLPFIIECKTDSYSGSSSVVPQWPNPPDNCIVANNTIALYSGSPPGMNLDSEGSWGDCGGGSSVQASCALDGSTCPDVSHWSLFAQKTVIAYRVTVDPDAENAIPDSWRSQVQDIGGFLGRKLTTTITPLVIPVTVEADAEVCGPQEFWDGSTGYDFDSTTEEETVCQLFNAGSFDPGNPPAGSFALNHIAAGVDCATGSSVGIAFEIFTDPGFFVQIPLV